MCTSSKNNSKLSTNDIHNQEHERWSRRSFLQALGLAGGGSMMLANANITAAMPSKLTQAIAEADTERILILLRLKGGNDGLNTIVPIYDFDRYAKARPTIHHKENTLYKLSDNFGMPAAMQPLQKMWGDGAMKIVHGVGYENQDLSHFKSSNIWASTDLNGEQESGYMGRYFEGLYPDFLINPPEIPAAIQIGSVGNLIFDGQGNNNYALTVSNPNQLQRIGETGTLHSLTNLPDCAYGDRLSYLRSVTNNTFTYAKTIFKAYSKGTNAVEYSDNDLGKQLAIVAKMIKGNLGTKVYMLSVDGFDTHANQSETHGELLQEVSKNITLFYEDLKATEKDTQVLTMSISEFGRRVEENGSNGTDHGQAAPVLFFGPALNGNGLLGEHPDLNDLDVIGNLKFKTDFRQLYATVMSEWLCIDSQTVNETLLANIPINENLGFSCKATSTEVSNPLTAEVSNTTKVSLLQTDNRDTVLTIDKIDTSHVDVAIYSVTGQRLAVLKNAVLDPGEYKFNLTQQLGNSYGTAIYIYRVLSGGRRFSGKFYL